MRIAFVGAGAGNAYCGACHRDVSLVLGLRGKGNDVLFMPFYTRLTTEAEDPTNGPLFCGGINAYLQQAIPLFRKTPRWMDRLWDMDFLLRFASRFAVKTSPEALGDMTVSVLQGERGFQRKELERLVQHLSDHGPFDAVYLTNSLLSGLVPMLKKKLDIPILCGLQGEEEFLSRLKETHRREARDWLQKNCQQVDQFHAPHGAYAAKMALFLGLPRDRFHVVPPGVDTAQYPLRDERAAGASESKEKRDKPFQIAFVGRLSPEKGLLFLAEALSKMDAKDLVAADLASSLWRLVVAGTGDRKAAKEHLSDVEYALSEGGGLVPVAFHGEISLQEKVRLLHSCDLFCQPSLFPEQRAMSSLEALCCGIPVVAPTSGIFPELAKKTGAVLLFDPGDSSGLAQNLQRACRERDQWTQQGRRASQVIRDHYCMEAAVDAVLEGLEKIL